MMTPSVSVIIPTWNRAGTIETALTSALRQTLAPFEIIVCDDGSRDGTKEIVAAIKDNRIVWSPGDHGGQAAIPRNRGLAESKGEWIAFLDSDDEWLPEKLERQVSLAAGLGCRAVAANAVRRVPGQGIRGTMVAWRKEKLSFADLLVTNRIVCSTAVIHRSLLSSVGRFPEEQQLVIGEDYAFWLRVAALTDFAFVPQPLAIYLDDARHSIRRTGPGPFAVRRHVVANFLEWCAREGISEQHRQMARRGLRPARVIGSHLARRWTELRDRGTDRSS